GNRPRIRKPGVDIPAADNGDARAAGMEQRIVVDPGQRAIGVDLADDSIARSKDGGEVFHARPRIEVDSSSESTTKVEVAGRVNGHGARIGAGGTGGSAEIPRPDDVPIAVAFD